LETKLKIDEILNHARGILTKYNNAQLNIIQVSFEKKIVSYIENVVKIEEIKRKNSYKISEIIKKFTKNYAYLRNDKIFFYFTDGEWEYTTVDKIYDKWLTFLKNLIFHNSQQSNDEKKEMLNVYTSRRLLFKRVKQIIYKQDLLVHYPGKILKTKTIRIFKYLGLNHDDLNYLFAFLGYCCTHREDSSEDTFFEQNHVWIGYKVWEVIKSIHKIVGANSYFRLIKHTVMTDDFTKVCCINFPYSPNNRKLFIQNMLNIPLQTKMVFSYFFKNWNSQRIQRIGTLKDYDNKEHLVKTYVSQNYQPNNQHIIFLDEFYEDLKNWLFQKFIPKSAISIKYFTLYLEEQGILLYKKSDKKTIAIYGQLPLITRHQFFLQFLIEYRMKAETLGTNAEKNTNKELYALYSNWCEKKSNDNLVEHNFLFKCTRNELNEFMTIDYHFDSNFFI
jgi:hypothetical protein